MVMLVFLLWGGVWSCGFPHVLLERAENHSCPWPTDRPLTQLETQRFSFHGSFIHKGLSLPTLPTRALNTVSEIQQGAHA